MQKKRRVSGQSLRKNSDEKTEQLAVECLLPRTHVNGIHEMALPNSKIIAQKIYFCPGDRSYLIYIYCSF